MEHIIWFEDLDMGWVMGEEVLTGVNDEGTEERDLSDLLPQAAP